MFSTHIYTFGGKLYRQAKGGPIGLRGTCALARVIMNVWDNMWEEQLRKVNIEWEDYFRYMDDGRIFLHPVKRGWRWEDGDLKYREEWKEEDKDLTSLEVTRKVIHGSLQGVLNFLKFTTETEEEYDSG